MWLVIGGLVLLGCRDAPVCDDGEILTESIAMCPGADIGCRANCRRAGVDCGVDDCTDPANSRPPDCDSEDVPVCPDGFGDPSCICP